MHLRALLYHRPSPFFARKFSLAISYLVSFFSPFPGRGVDQISPKDNSFIF